MSRARLHQSLARDHPLALVRVQAAAGVLLEDRGLRLLRLQDDRVVVVEALHQQDPGPRADAAHADHLAGHVDAAGTARAGACGRSTASGGRTRPGSRIRANSSVASSSVSSSVTGTMSGGVLTNRAWPSTVVVSLSNACRLSLVLALATRRSVRPRTLRLQQRLDPGELAVDVQVRVPDVQVGLIGEGADRLPVGPGRGEHHRLAFLALEPVVPAGDLQARGQPLHVPLERAGQRLVEVVDVEDESPFRRGEDPEVGQVRVTAQLGPQPGVRRAGQVGRHDERRPAVERERRDQHPPVPDRHELGHPAGRLPLEQLDRVGPQLRRGEHGVGLERNLGAGREAPGDPVRPARRRRRGGPPDPASTGIGHLDGGQDVDLFGHEKPPLPVATVGAGRRLVTIHYG